ncbi:MAG: DUF4012 domain-containing protein [Chloroflexi bacterium]|nr:DUF4012 domain-containing protein [Chloroflexota bacterium]
MTPAPLWLSKRWWILVAVLIALLLVLTKAFFVGQAVLAVRQDYEHLRPLLASPAELTRPETIANLETLLDESEADLRALRAQVGPLFALGPVFGWVPRYGGDLAQAAALVDYSLEAAAFARLLLEMYHSAAAVIPADGGVSKDAPRGDMILNALDTFRASANDLRSQQGRVTAARQLIEPRRLSPSLADLIRRGDTALEQSRAALGAVEVLPQLLGVREPRRYLLIAQNNDELRATGGYISGIGLVQIQDGKIVQLDYRDSYLVEDYGKPHPWPPKPLTDYMRAQTWVTRDANWSPDFPTSAQQIERFYELNQGIRVDGVIAVNLNAVQRVVAALGPIYLPAYGERVDGDNVLQRMEYYFISPAGVSPSDDWWKHRKDFMSALVGVLGARLNGEQGALDARRIGLALWSSLAAKDILVYLNDAPGQEALAEFGWSGALPAPARDFVLVVDSNVGFNKVDRNIERLYDYRVEFKAGERATASLRIQYANLNPPSAEPCRDGPSYGATYPEMSNNCYWDYVRLYVPLGSTPFSATGDISATLESPELGYTVFSGYFVLPRGETREIRFDYELPWDAPSGNAPADYSLTWIKQPGTAAAPVSVTLVLPDSMHAADAEPAPVSRDGSAIEFLLAPDRDATLSVQFAPPAAGLQTLLIGLGGLLFVAGLVFVYRLGKSVKGKG